MTKLSAAALVLAACFFQSGYKPDKITQVSQRTYKARRLTAGNARMTTLAHAGHLWLVYENEGVGAGITHHPNCDCITKLETFVDSGHTWVRSFDQILHSPDCPCEEDNE